MTGALAAFALLLASLVVAPAVAPVPVDEPLTLRVSRLPEGTAWVGQRVSLYVTVVLRGAAVRTPRFELPLVDGGIFRQAPGSPVLGNESIAGVAHTTQRFELLLFPQQEGEVVVPPVTVRAAVGDDEGLAVTASVTVPVRRPDGVASSGPVLTSADVTATQAWESTREEATVGDAFTRTVTIRARDLLGIAVPPLPVPRVDGLGAYPDAPLVDESMSRGSLTATRTDRVTFVCERAGTFTLPDLIYRWYDPTAGRAREQLLPGRTVRVTSAPQEASGDGRAAPAPWGRGVGPWLVGPGTALVVAFLLRRRLAAGWTALRTRRAAGEAAAYAALARACDVGRPRDAWPALFTWLDRVHVGETADSLAAWRERCPDASAPSLAALAEAAEPLQRALVGGATWDGAALRAAARAHRRAVQGRRRREGQALTPTLNP